jgi:hypothetical protein
MRYWFCPQCNRDDLVLLEARHIDGGVQLGLECGHSYPYSAAFEEMTAEELVAPRPPLVWTD